MSMGKGGSGGGGSSGTVSYPEYFQDFHAHLLNRDGTDVPQYSVVMAMDDQREANPFIGFAAYSPVSYISKMDSLVETRLSELSSYDPTATYAVYMPFIRSQVDTNGIPEATLLAEEAAFNAGVDAEYVNHILPTYQRGMQDIGAVISSSFTIGAGLILAENARKKAQFSADLRLQAAKQKNAMVMDGVGQLIQLWSGREEVYRTAIVNALDTYRIDIVALKEQIEENLLINEREAKWNMESLTNGANILAVAQGAVAGMTTPVKATGSSMLGGALSGAASGAMMGSMFGPGYGTVIGAVAGAVLGAVSSSQSK